MPLEQLELFQLPEEPTRARRRLGPMGPLQIRQDHAALMMVVGLIGLSIVFALGVERGRQLARSERTLLAPYEAIEGRAQTTPEATPKDFTPSAPMPSKAAPKAVPTPPTKAVREKSRFAVQVVSYRRPKLARLELQRLQRQGERAFLLMKEDKLILFVGPFGSKENAQAKLASLRARYQDCFLRTL